MSDDPWEYYRETSITGMMMLILLPVLIGMFPFFLLGALFDALVEAFTELAKEKNAS